MTFDVPALLDEVCVKLGLCLEPGERSRISIATPRDVDGLADAILVGAGRDPVFTDRRLRHELREYVARFADHFTD
jgi:hypothetical protein